MGYANVRFVKGDIEEMPLPDNKFDVVVSNCVLNLVSDKHKAFAEIWRVLKPGRHFCVFDVVVKGILPDKLPQDAEMYVGCISGAINMDDYLEIINKQGFKNFLIVSHSPVRLFALFHWSTRRTAVRLYILWLVYFCLLLLN